MSKTAIIEDTADVAEPVLDPTTGGRGVEFAEADEQAPRRMTRKPVSYKIPEGVDPAKWYREKGKPPLTRHYRVTAQKGGKPVYVHECHAVDPTEAISFCAVAAGIKASVQHSFSFLVVQI